jgi:hypothetical protein
MKIALALAGAAIGFLAFRPRSPRVATAPVSPEDVTRLARTAEKYRGVQIAVASELGLSRPHVSLVCRGFRRSRRVEKALAEAVLRIQKEAA